MVILYSPHASPPTKKHYFDPQNFWENILSIDEVKGQNKKEMKKREKSLEMAALSIHLV